MQIKIVLIGASNAGKTCIYRRYMENDYNPSSQATVSAAFSVKLINLDEKEVQLQLWDTAGQEKYQSVSAVYFRNAKIAFVVFDLTDMASFKAIPLWVQKVNNMCDETTVMMLLGNKCDLTAREVSETDISKYTLGMNVLYREVSAKTGQGVVEAFEEAVRLAIKVQKEPRPTIATINITDEEDQKKSCC